MASCCRIPLRKQFVSRACLRYMFYPKNDPLGKYERARRPVHQQSAGGGVYVAEEQMKFASSINFRP